MLPLHVLRRVRVQGAVVVERPTRVQHGATPREEPVGPRHRVPQRVPQAGHDVVAPVDKREAPAAQARRAGTCCQHLDVVAIGSPRQLLCHLAKDRLDLRCLHRDPTEEVDQSVYARVLQLSGRSDVARHGRQGTDQAGGPTACGPQVGFEPDPCAALRCLRYSAVGHDTVL